MTKMQTIISRVGSGTATTRDAKAIEKALKAAGADVLERYEATLSHIRTGCSTEKDARALKNVLH